MGFVFAFLMYYLRLLNPAEAKVQFPAVHRFLTHKWYFDELYSAIIVRPGLAIAHWARAFDTYVIDGLVNGVASFFVVEAREFRLLQTGRVRSYGFVMLLGALGTVFLVVLFLGYLPVRLGG